MKTSLWLSYLSNRISYTYKLHLYIESGPRPPLSKCKTWAMMTSSNGNIIHVTGPLCGEFTGHRWIPLTKAVTRSFDVFFDLRLNKQLSRKAGDLRRHRAHYDVTVMLWWESIWTPQSISDQQILSLTVRSCERNSTRYDSHQIIFRLFQQFEIRPFFLYNEVVGGYTGFTPSVRPSVRPACRVRSVSSTVMDGLFSY